MRKGQAALEYLTTYGWVMLVIVITIGALTYYGYLNPSRFIPDRCSFGPQMVCEDYQLLTDGTLKWKVRNNFGKAIRITGVSSVTTDYSLNACTSGLNVDIGEIREIQCTISDTSFLAEGDKYSIPASIIFRRNDTASAPEHQVTGEIYTMASQP